MAQVVGKEACPECRSIGRDNSGNNLARYSDGGAHCFSCGYTERSGGAVFKREEEKVESKGGMEVYNSLPFSAAHDVSLEVCKHFGIKVGINEITGQPENIYYPYYSEDGKLVAAKVRKVSSKDFFWIGQPGKAALFGQQNIGQGGQMVVIVEGEKDALAMTEMFRRSGKNYKVVSIKDGASLPKKGEKLPKPDTTIAAQLDLISKFSCVVVALDNDKPGTLTAQAMAELIAPVTKVKIMSYPEGYKDAHDLLVGTDKAPAAPEKIMKLLMESKDFVPEAIYCGNDIALEDLMKPLEKGAEIPFSGLQEKLQGLRKGELTTLTSSSGAGKSTLCREFAYTLVKSGYKVANIFLEESLEKTAQSFIALDNNIPLSRLRATPNAIDPEDYAKSYNELVANGRNFFFKHFGSLDSEVLMNKMRYFAKAMEVDYIFLDHLSVVVSGSDESDDERKLLDKICTKLAAFCTETGVGVIMVCHMRRQNSGQKSASQGGMITLDDLRGSGGIAQLSFNVVAAMRDTTAMETDKANILQLWVLKNREHGFTGPAGRLLYNKFTGRLEEITE